MQAGRKEFYFWYTWICGMACDLRQDFYEMQRKGKEFMQAVSRFLEQWAAPSPIPSPISALLGKFPPSQQGSFSPLL
jgi:hypothetical protein